MEQDGDCHVIQVLRSKNFYETLLLSQGHEIPSFCTTKHVRRKYKEIALLVHPDRNRSQRAEEAFKKVGEAYECLVDETSQTLYLKSILKFNKNDGRFGNKKVPSGVKRKRSDHEEEHFTSKPTFVRRKRTPKEIWEAFQREEEDMARKHFHKKGFDRVFNDDFESIGNEKEKSPLLDEGTKSKVLESNLDEKASTWKQWSSSSSSSKKEIDDDEVEQKKPCCLLCRRRFRSIEHLERHEMVSEMHKVNVSVKQKTEQSANSSNRS